MYLRKGRPGYFLGCSEYPERSSTRSVTDDAAQEIRIILGL
jgi:hypothetical protein